MPHCLYAHSISAYSSSLSGGWLTEMWQIISQFCRPIPKIMWLFFFQYRSSVAHIWLTFSACWRCYDFVNAGYLACARCSSTGSIVLVEPVSAVNSFDQPLMPPRSERCSNCSGSGKVLERKLFFCGLLFSFTCLYHRNLQRGTEHDTVWIFIRFPSLISALYLVFENELSSFFVLSITQVSFFLFFSYYYISALKKEHNSMN